MWINDHITMATEMPHGGFKQSGYGKDMSKYALEDYTIVKHVMVNLEAEDSHRFLDGLAARARAPGRLGRSRDARALAGVVARRRAGDELEPDDCSYRIAWRSRIPYALEFEFTVDELDEPRSMSGAGQRRARGDGHWRLFEQDGVTAVTYEWNVAHDEGVDERDRRRSPGRCSRTTTTS